MMNNFLQLMYKYRCEHVILYDANGASICRSVMVVLLLLSSHACNMQIISNDPSKFSKSRAWVCCIFGASRKTLRVSVRGAVIDRAPDNS